MKLARPLILAAAALLIPLTIHAAGPYRPSVSGGIVDSGSTRVVVSAHVNPNGDPTVAKIQYGLTTDYGSEVEVPLSPNNGTSIQKVSVTVTGLTPTRNYHFRITATNSLGTSNSYDSTFFTSSPSLPIAYTYEATTIGATSVVFNGLATSGDLLTEVKFESGVGPDYGTNTLVAITAFDEPVVQHLGGGAIMTSWGNSRVSATLAGLTPNTTYHFRISASNMYGTKVGEDFTFTTLAVDAPQPPYIGAVKVGGLGAGPNNQRYASSSFLMSPNGSWTNAIFQYGLTTDYEQAIPLALSPNNCTPLQLVAVSLKGLSGGTTYHYRVTASNTAGITNTADQTFTTLRASTVPSISAVEVVGIKQSQAQLRVSINPNYERTSAKFQYGLTTDYGNDFPIVESFASTPENHVRNLANLTPGTTYHCRVTATNVFGTTDSPDVTFTTLLPPGLLLTYEMRIDPSASSPGVVVATDRKSAIASAAGDVIAVQLFAIVNSRNARHDDDGFLMGSGSFLSGNDDLPGDFRGDTAGQPATHLNNASGFQHRIAQSGFVSDLDGDGDQDVGSLQTSGSSNPSPFFLVRSDAGLLPIPQLGTGSGTGPTEILIGQTTFTISAKAEDGQSTTLNFAPQIIATGSTVSIFGRIHEFKLDGAMLFLPGNDPSVAVGAPIQVTLSMPPVIPPVLQEPPAALDRGYYSGLLHDADGRPEGLVFLAMNAQGAFTGRVSSKGFVKSFRGASISEAVTIAVPSLGLLKLSPNAAAGIDLSLGSLTGVASKSPFTFDSPAPQRGRYRLRLSPDPTLVSDTATPKGSGGAVVVVTALGVVRCAGRTADAAGFSFGSTVHEDGALPFYDQLYVRPHGRIGGTLGFRNVPEVSDLDGTLLWTKPAQARASARIFRRNYPAGFTDIPVTATGSRAVSR